MSFFLSKISHQEFSHQIWVFSCLSFLIKSEFFRVQAFSSNMIFSWNSCFYMSDLVRVFFIKFELFCVLIFTSNLIPCLWFSHQIWIFHVWIFLSNLSFFMSKFSCLNVYVFLIKFALFHVWVFHQIWFLLPDFVINSSFCVTEFSYQIFCLSFLNQFWAFLCLNYLTEFKLNSFMSETYHQSWTLLGTHFRIRFEIFRIWVFSSNWSFFAADFYHEIWIFCV